MDYYGFKVLSEDPFAVELFHQFLRVIVILVLRQFEDLLVHLPDIGDPDQPFDVGLEGFELEVVLPLVVGDHGDTVLELEGVGVSSIVDQDHITLFPVYYPKVLYVHPLRGQETMLPVETVLDDLPFRV